MLISPQDDKDESLCHALTHAHTLSPTRWDVTTKDSAVAPLTVRARRGPSDGNFAVRAAHVSAAAPPAPSASLPNAGWRMTNRLPRGRRETRAEKRLREKKQLSALALSCI